MNAIDTMINRCINNTSPMEAEVISNGCKSTARWIVDKLFPSLTETQAESIAFQLWEHFNHNLSK